MEAICAWCRTQLESTPEAPPFAGATTHGLCDACAHHLGAQQGMELERYLEGLPVPILLLDDDASVLFANGRAREILGKELPETRRRRIGEVFECVWALSPRGCGRTEHCSGCAIRRSVTETHRTGLPLSGVRARLCRTSPEGEERTWLRISTSLAGDVVLLRVEGLDQLPEEGSRD